MGQGASRPKKAGMQRGPLCALSCGLPNNLLREMKSDSSMAQTPQPQSHKQLLVAATAASWAVVSWRIAFPHVRPRSQPK